MKSKILALQIAVVGLATLAASCGSAEPVAQDADQTAAETQEGTDEATSDETAEATAEELIDVRVGIIPIVDVAPLMAAIDLGYFEEVGLNVEATPVAGGAAAIPALVAGEFQFAYSNVVSIYQAVSEGVPATIVAGGNQQTPEPPDTAEVIVSAESTAASGADLEGKRFGVNTRNNIIHLFAMAWIDATGGDSSSVTFVEVPFPQMADAIASGQIDAGMLGEPLRSAAESAGQVKSIGSPYSSVAGAVPVAQWVSLEPYTSENPDVVEAFVDGYTRGVEWINENVRTEEGAQLISSYTGVEASQLEGIDLPEWSPNVDVEAVNEVGQLMVEYGLIDEAPNATDFIAEWAVEN